LPSIFSVTGSPITTSGTLAATLATQSANTVFAGPSSGGAYAPTFRALVSSDMPQFGSYTASAGTVLSTDTALTAIQKIDGNLQPFIAPPTVGAIFSEAWTNLSSWTTVGSPSPAVSAGQLSFYGTAGAGNYIQCSGYGITNYERMVFTDSVVVGTIGAGTSGIAIGVQSQVTTALNSFFVNIEMSSTKTGTIEWYYNGTLVSTSIASLTLTAGDVLVRTLRFEKNRYIFTVHNNNTGKEITDSSQIDLGYVASFNLPYANAGNFAYYYLGGSTHKVNPFAVSSNHKKNADLLVIGDSRVRGSNTQNINSRVVDKLAVNYNGIFEVLAQSGDRCQDINTVEITALNPFKILLCIGINNILNESAGTAFTNFQALVTALAALTPSNAPSGYSIANGNLVIGLIEASTSNVTTFNASILSTYTNSGIIDFYTPSWSGTGTTINPAYTIDGTHYNSLFSNLKTDIIARYFGFSTKINNLYGSNFVVKNRLGYTGIGSQDFDPQAPLHILSPSNGFSSLIISSNQTNPIRGGSLTSVSDNQLYSAAGAYWNGSTFIATSTVASFINMQNGNVIFQGITGTTIGSSITLGSTNNIGAFGPNGRPGLSIGANGYQHTGNASLHTYDSQSQINFSTSTTKAGGFLTSNAASQALVSGGAYFNGTSFVATDIYSSCIDASVGNIGFKTATGLTAGNTFTYNTTGLFNSTGFYIGGAVSATALMHMAASTTSVAQMRFTAGGSAPTSPNIGDIWANSTDLQLNGLGFALNTVGAGLKIKEGSNATMGVATLVAGTVTISTTKVTASSRIYLSIQSLGTVTVPTTVAVTTVTASTSFVIKSANIVDTSVISWIIIEPS
jgi:hypothetical protein